MILSNEYQNKVLDLFRGYGIPPISKFWIGLVNTSGSEVSGSSYQRIEYDASSIAWLSTQGTVAEESNGTTGKISNVANVNWGTILEDWGKVDRVRFYLANTGTDYFCDNEITPTDLFNGTEVSIIAGDLILRTKDGIS